MSESFQHISKRLDKYINKYYNITILRGIIVFVALNSLLLLVFSIFSYAFEANSQARLILAILLGFSVIISLFIWIVIPILKRLSLFNRMRYMDAARRIEKKDPTIGEKLINAIQLEKITEDSRDLISAGIDQITVSIKVFDLASYVRLKSASKALVSVFPALIIVVGALVFGELNNVIEGSNRLLDFSTEYTARDFVEFHFDSKRSVNEGLDYELEFSLKSEIMPSSVIVYVNGNEIPVKRDNGRYLAKVRNVKDNLSFYVSAGRYTSDNFDVSVIKQARITDFIIQTKPPSYTGLKGIKLVNEHTIEIPENTEVMWNFLVQNSSFIVVEDQSESLVELEDNHALYKNTYRSSQSISVYSENKGFNMGSFELRVIKDKFPSIKAELVYDSLVANQVSIAGLIADDYGFRSLVLVTEENDIRVERVININPRTREQGFYERITIDSDQKVWLEVRDNDVYNGYKKTSSQFFYIEHVDKKDLKSESLNSSEEARKSLEEQKKSLEKNELSKEKTRKNQEDQYKNIEQNLEDILKQTEEFDKVLEKEKNNELYEDKILKLQEEIQERVKELDDDVKDLLEEIARLQEELYEQAPNEEELSDLDKELQTLEEEMERTLELLKRLEMEKRLDNLINDIEELEEKQRELANSDDDNIGDQEELQKELDNLKEELEELKELGDDLEEQQIENLEDSPMEKADEKMKESSEKLEKNKKKGANEPQEDAADELKKMKEQLESAQDAMNMSSQTENIEDLRQILKNVMVLSKSEEDLIKGLRDANVGDPLYGEYMKHQGKLMTDSKVIKDSLYSLMKRVPAIENIVLKELNDIENYFNKSALSLKDNLKDRGVGEMQYVMTASNNLAVLLNQSMEAMQSAMSSEKQGEKSCNKPGSGKPGMSEMRKMQKQLQKDAEEMSKQQGGKKPGEKGKANGGKGGSEGLGRMMGRQEMLRMQIESLKQGENGEKNAKLLQEIEEMMRENEDDIANGNFDKEFFERQREIESKMLESEKAIMEREEDDKRESNPSLNEYEKRRVKELEKYLRNKGIDIEKFDLERIDLSPFYLDKSIERKQ